MAYPKQRTALGLGAGPSSRGYQLDMLQQIARDQLMNQNNKQSAVPWADILSQVAPMLVPNSLNRDLFNEGGVDSTQVYEGGGYVQNPSAQPFAHQNIDTLLEYDNNKDYYDLLDGISNGLMGELKRNPKLIDLVAQGQSQVPTQPIDPLQAMTGVSSANVAKAARDIKIKPVLQEHVNNLTKP